MRTRLAIVVALTALAALASVAAVVASLPGPSYLAVSAFTSEAVNDHRVKLSATVNGSIPRQPDAFISDSANLVVGLAWADLQSGQALVTTIHPVIGRDSNQNPDAWHAHTVRLAGGATPPNDFCLTAITSTPTAGIQIHGDEMRVNVAAGDLPFAAGAVDAAVGFTVHSDSACVATGLGVRIRTL
jgi:hypothetical protein